MQESFWKFYQKLGFPSLFNHHFPCNNNTTELSLLLLSLLLSLLSILLLILIIVYTLSTTLPIVLKKFGN